MAILENVQAPKSIHVITVKVLPVPWSAEVQGHSPADRGGGGGGSDTSPWGSTLTHWSPIMSHPWCLLEKEQEVWLGSFRVFALAASSACPPVVLLVSGTGLGCLLVPSRWRLQETSKVNDHLFGCLELLGDALWGASAAFQSSFQDSFSLKVVSYFHAPVFSISMFQPLIMTCLGTTLPVKDWISLNVFLSNQKSFWSGIWCTDR